MHSNMADAAASIQLCEYEKESGITRLITPNMTVSINGYQMSRFMVNSKGILYPFNSSLFALGVAHTVAKSKGEAGDVFNRERDILVKGVASADTYRHDSHNNLVGPRTMLHQFQTRLIILQQTKKAEGETPPPKAYKNTKEKKTSVHKDQIFYVHCLYDHDNICFVDPKGNCLFVCRNQLMVP